jgi:hypothetical protein
MASTIKVRARVTDLQREHEGGWSENGAYLTEHTFTFSEGASDATITRRIRQHFGLGADWRRDGWCAGDWVWRSGCLGCYADVVID